MKIIFVTNLYPSDKTPFKGSFVKNIYDEFSDCGVDTHLIKLKSFGSSKLLRVLAYLYFYLNAFFVALFSKKGDIIYIHYASHSSIGVFFASLIRKLKIVVNVHGSDALPEIYYGRFISNINYILSKLIFSRASVVISPSNYFKNVIQTKYHVEPDAIFVSPSGGVNNLIFSPKEIIKTDKSVKFAYVGRIEKAKGIFELLEAYIELLESQPNIRLIIIGSGTEYEKVKKIAEYYPSIEVHQGISQDKLSEFYSSFDFLVFPSHHESLGLVPIEAMMCGTPVISSDIEASKDYIRDELIDFVFAVGNKAALLESLNKALLISPETYIKLSSLSSKIASEYESKKVIHTLLSFFNLKK